MTKLVLINRLSPGDVLMMSGAIRDLHLSFPGEYQTDVRSPCNEIFLNSPYITSITDDEADQRIDMMYPLIHHSLRTGLQFLDGHRLYLQEKINRIIRKSSVRPDIHLSQDELNWVSQVRVNEKYHGPFWLINAGIKSDYTLKQYPYYQEVVDLLKDKVKFVQIGHNAHNHPPLAGVIDMRGKTDLRQLFRLSYQAEGAVCAVSLQMVIQQAFKKPCVVVAGGREGMRWQAVNDHRYLQTIGALDCCMEDGCWRSKLESCAHLEDSGLDDGGSVPKCMRMVRPHMIAEAVMMYYEGGRLQKG